jgi:hypothetical protein
MAADLPRTIYLVVSVRAEAVPRARLLRSVQPWLDHMPVLDTGLCR